MNTPSITTISLEPVDNRRLAALCGQQNEHLHQVERHFNVVISHRGNHFQIKGQLSSVNAAERSINQLYSETLAAELLTPAKIQLYLKSQGANSPMDKISPPQTLDNPDSNRSNKEIVFHTKGGIIKAQTENQRNYLNNISQYDVSFCIGPAGTGKTYLAVASAVDALEKGNVQRILLVRPAVEAGEKLGFLPGDLVQKVEPYLRPLYDALFEMLGFERVAKLLEQNIIEIAPLAFMRGRTLNDSFIILDESQNTTIEQMKMFLTRIGFGSKAIITGDVTQTDLPRGKKSGLLDAIDVLREVPEICFSMLESKDVVRHSLVQRIVEAYDKFEKNRKRGR